MRYSELFAKTKKTAPAEEVAVNARLLIQGGFIDKLMAGSYTLLPLGKRVEKKIQDIIREEINKTGGQEVLMPLLHPKEIWNETGRWETAKEVMYQFEKNEKEYALSFTHEEIVLDLVRKHVESYKDLPVKIYHFSTKFRNEPRAKSGILRGREFLMKDLYSLHLSEQDMDKYYWEVTEAYKVIFKRLGFDTKVVEASGGVFTERFTHEFQVPCEAGEDLIFYCERCDFAQNKEIATVKEGEACPKCQGNVKQGKSVEVGNIFRFGTVYNEKMNAMYTDENGQRRYPFFASFGIGVTRLIGTLVELFHDEKGIMWPETVAPYKVYLIGIMNNESRIREETDTLYKQLHNEGIEVLYDDREDTSVGKKFADADLIGIPYRLVISEKTGDKIEVKKRSEQETRLLSKEELMGILK
jgi:prolyl-tRNA synthetase